MKALVTGGLGFIGSHLALFLKDKGYKVTILTRSMEKAYNLGKRINEFNFIEGNIESVIFNKDEKYDEIYHCASTVDNYNIFTDPFLDVDTNLNGTINLLNQFKGDKNVKVLYVSTFFCDGNDVNEPLALYGATKLCAEHICKTYTRVFGLQTLIARPSNVYGIGEQVYNNKKAAFNRMAWDLCNDKEVELYAEEYERNFINVKDVVSGLYAIVQNGELSIEKIYPVCNTEHARIIDMMLMVQETCGRGRFKKVRTPEFHKQVGIRDYIVFPTDLLQLGWEPKISNEDGIRNLVENYNVEICNAR